MTDQDTQIQSSIDSLPAGDPVLDDTYVDVAGGKLSGNHDDFQRELEEKHKAVPGAEKHHHPAHTPSKGKANDLSL